MSVENKVLDRRTTQAELRRFCFKPAPFKVRCLSHLFLQHFGTVKPANQNSANVFEKRKISAAQGNIRPVNANNFNVNI